MAILFAAYFWLRWGVAPILPLRSERDPMLKTTRPASKLLGSVALAAMLSLAACEDNRTSLFIRGVIPAEVDTTTGGCSIDGASDTLLTGGIVDVGLTTGYTLDLSVANQLLARANRSSTTAEVNRVTLNRAEIRISSSTAVRRSRFSSIVSGIVDPSADGSTPGLGFVSVNVVEPDLATELFEQLGGTPGQTAELVAYVKLFGETLGGNDIETDFFQYPFTACVGCLVFFPVADGVPDCSATDTAPTTCRIGQNASVPCSRCQANPLCQP
jgi:hypothetical protein